jgi:hypothetical protein
VDDIDPFESPKELIQGAKEQLAQLELECRSFGDNCPYRILTQIDRKTGENVVTLRLQNIFPARLRRFASSILKEIRLALDQAMCDAAVELGRTDANGVYFPFGKSAADLRESRKAKCRKVDRRIVAFAMKFKPYYGGNPVLWTLANLATVSHQRIVGAQAQDKAAFGNAILQCTGPLNLTINLWSDPNQELEVARLPPGASITFKSDFVLSLDVIFSKAAYAVAGRPLVATLHDMIGIADSIVLGIEAETARLKALKP